MKAAHLEVIPSPETEAANDVEAPASVEHPLAHGRKVIVNAGSDRPIEVIAPDGRVEVAIVMTADGPVVKVEGARLELAAPESVHVKTGKLTIDASEGVDLKSKGPVVLEGKKIDLGAPGDVTVKGARIFLN